MKQLPLKQKVPLVLSYAQKAGWIATPTPCEAGPFLTQVVAAAGDRIKTSGDILQFPEFFVADEQLAYDEKDFAKQIAASVAVERLQLLRQMLVLVEPYEASVLEESVKELVQRQGWQLGQIIHPLRVAITGKSVGLGLYEALVILGRERSLARIDQAIARATR